ncbi:ferrous iron transport protein B [Actimicrobium sp. CCI2.3]|uniref:ferrous iron transport protein B n=1 Tax=Actimicrobium sp. CCI2.3 TaxID=3048616 RepID=UPI002AB56ECB|nr:ferrous iron transport protein B [Actimicrobium sp. CCI2.3]MDY7574031.1 ferrous iron transport protein B [Actimicrobium sp. CCI2.3]MEB0021861.1 ferrous iron transport protein B [Actimicrobium sp. CCI2.3]
MKRIALLGMPNAGKSTFFNRLTGASARVGNWPGVTVDLLGAKVLIGASMVEAIDLPGIYDLQGFSEDEEVVRRFLSLNPVDLALVIINTAQIERQLSLVLQLKHLGVPMVVLLNMSDEAKKLGITIDAPQLSNLLDCPVALISAKYGNGYQSAYQLIQKELNGSRPPVIVNLASPPLAEPALEAAMAQVMNTSVQIPAHASDQLTQRMDRVLLHPVAGLPIFFFIMFLLFQGIFILGKPIQDGLAWLFQLIRTSALEPLMSVLPAPVTGLLLDGIYNGVGTVASFVPLIVLFFLFMALVEDSGYLSRAAFLMDALMAKMGLDGRSFVMVLMGFGCNVPALMGTRVMRSRPLRLLTMLVIPFSLCSARLQVFVFFIAALFTPRQAPLVLFSLYMMSFATTLLSALLFKSKFANSEPFILEMPPYRFPTWRQMALRGLQEVHHFMHRATKFIIIGVVLVYVLTNFPTNVAPASSGTIAGWLGSSLAPILDPIGINMQLAIALIFGFVAKEIVIGSLAVIYGLDGSALVSTMANQIDWVQAYSFMLFTLIYTPCLSTIATIRSESRSRSFTLLALVWPLTLAWVVSFVFYRSARAFGY